MVKKQTDRNVDWEVYAAELYDKLLLLKPYQSYLQDIVRAVGIHEDEALLDAGCGTGNILQAIASSGSAVQLYGIDRSTAMLNHTKRKVTATINLQQGDLAESLPYQDHFFSVVTCGNVLYTVQNPKAVLQELQRVLRPGGRLVLTTPKYGYEGGLILKDHCGSTEPDEAWFGIYESAEREETLIRKAFTDTAMIKSFIEIGEYNRQIQKSGITTFYKEAELAQLLSSCGFIVTTINTTYADQVWLLSAQTNTGSA